jgi:O-antigen ligase
MTMTGADVTPARPRDPALGYLARLVLLGLPAGLLLYVAHSRTLDALVAGVVGLAVLARFPAPLAVRLSGTALVLAPDAVVVAHLGGGTPLSVRECAFVGLGVTCLAAAVRGRLRPSVPAPLLTTVVLVIAVLGAAANDRPKSLLEFTVLVVVPLVSGATIGTDLAVARDFVRGLAVGTILLAGWALVEAATNHNVLVASTVLGSFEREGHIRANAGWDYPTMLAAFLCLGAFFVVHHLWERWRWPGFLIGGVLVTAAVIATQSRSGLIGLGAGAVAYLVMQRRLSQVVRVLGGLIAAGAALLLIPGAAPAGFRSFLGQSFDQGTSANANVQYRQDLYHAAGAAMAHQPVWGYGWGAGKSVATNGLSTYFGTQVDLASLPVSLGVQLGYVGAGAVGVFLLLVVVQLTRHRDVPERLPIGAGIVGCTVAMLGVPVSPPLAWLLLVAALGWSVTRTSRAPHPPDESPTYTEPDSEFVVPRTGHWVTGGARR